MSDLVVDASVVTKFFSPSPERFVDQATMLGDAIAEGRVRCRAPELLVLEVLNVGARRWKLEEPALRVLVAAIEDLGIDLVAVDYGRVAAWSARGLSAYDAAYVAVAESASLRLITDDEQIVQVAGDIALPLSRFAASQ